MEQKEFDPRNITQESMDIFANVLEQYLDLLHEVMIIPPEIERKHAKVLKEAEKQTRKLIKKLRNGKAEEIFKDPDEWDIL